MRRTMVMLAAFPLAILFGTIGQSAGSNALYLLSGLLFLTGLAIAISYLPFWKDLPRAPQMDGLFPRIGRGERLDPDTGDATLR